MDVRPEDMRDHLARRGAAPTAAAAAAEAAPAERSGGAASGPAAREALLQSIAASYFSLRIGLSVLALAFPILLWLAAGGGGIEPSISAYYHQAAPDAGGLLGRQPRDIFVGVLCAIGAFLWLYKGYRTSENIALNIAGLAAACIALFPTDGGRTSVGVIHSVAAVSFFLAVAYVCLFEAKATLPLVPGDARRRTFAATYRLLGAAMVLLPAAVFAIHKLRPVEARQGSMIFWLEFVAIWVFAAFWIAKSLEIRIIRKAPAA